MQSGAEWKCTNCPLSCSTKMALRQFQKARCLGDCVRSYVQQLGSTSWTCSNAASVAMLLLLPSSFRARLLTLVLVQMENSFQHELTPEPDADGKFRCKPCGRASVKNSLRCIRNTLCYGSNATTRAKAIAATRAVHGLSHSSNSKVS